ncbi:MAG: PAS domain S-box protein [Bacteroidetes bacterium]|nr:PAS domain S-box protein [Bacteroidota bacterium]
MLNINNGNNPLQILYLEDSQKDVELVREVLADAGIYMELEFVAKEEAYVASLRKKKFDLILADYNLPGFIAPAALSIAKKICPETPFICVSGAIGEDAAVELLKNGATDYVSKERLKRLPLVVESALHDIALKSERKRTIESTKLSEARLADAQSFAHLGSWEWDLTNDKITWSKELFRLFEISGESKDKGIDYFRVIIDNRIHPDDLPLYKAAVALSLSQKTPYSVDYRIQLPGGLVRHINAQGDYKQDDSGRIVKMVGTAMDITSRKQMEEALKESEERYRMLADHMQDIVWLMDMNFKVTYQSPSSEKMRGFTSQEIKELPMEKNLAPESLKLALELFYRELPRIEIDTDYNPITTMELEYYRKDGTTFWLENKFSIMRNGGGKPVSILGEGRDITERKRAEEELNSSLSLLEATLESIHNGILVVNSQGAVIKTNNTFAKMWHIPEDVLASRDDSVLLKHVMNQLSDQEEFIAKVTELYEKPESETLDVINFKDGRFFERISKPMMLDGKPKGRVWSFLDITARKQSDDALREERWRLANIVEATRAGTWEWNVQTGEAVFNDMWAEMVGYTIEELSPTNLNTWQSLVHPDDLVKSNKLLDRHYTGEITYYDCECRIKHKDGRWIWIHDRGRVITRTCEGKPLLMFGAHSDISDRKLVEEQLQIKDFALESSPTAVGLADINGIVFYANAAFVNMWGFSNKTEIIGMHISEFSVPESPSDQILAFVRQGNTFYGETNCMRKDGSVFAALISSGFVKSTEGQLMCLMALFVDISELKTKEAEIINKNEELVKTNAEKDKFFSIIAHDLRSPFNAFLGFTQILVEELDTLTLKEIQEIAVSMRSSATNLFRLLENLLEWSRIRRGVTPFDPESLLLTSAITEAIRPVVDSANKKGIKISYDIPEEYEVFADKYMLASTVRNLASNALKFTFKGGEITIAANLSCDNTIEISIKDTGIGMNKKMIANLFRLDENTNRKGTEGEPSSGLGLIICKEFVDKHGGKLWVESQEGQGSVFYFTLPMIMKN